MNREKKPGTQMESGQNVEKGIDNGGCIVEYFDVVKVADRVQEQKRVFVDLPVWMVKDLEKEAQRLSISTQTLVRIWIAEKLALGTR